MATGIFIDTLLRMVKSVTLRRQYVESMQRRKVIRSPAIRQAFLDVPRETFVPEIAAEKGLSYVYNEWAALVTKKNQYGVPMSSSTQPNLMARMLEALDIKPGHRVLEIGAGTGYNAALLSHLVGSKGKVVSVDIDPEVAGQAKQHLAAAGFKARVFVGDGREGWTSEAPFDRIILSAHAKTVPTDLLDQLAPDGLLQIPLLLGPSAIAQVIPTFAKTGTASLTSIDVIDGGFMALRDDAEGLAMPPDFYVVAYDFVKGKGRSIASLWGPGIARAQPSKRAQLLRMVLEEKPLAPLDFRAGNGLFMYMTLAAEDNLIGGWLVTRREVIGVIEGDPPGLAVMPVRNTKSGVLMSQLLLRGSQDAERLLRRIIGEWRALGEPAPTSLHLRVSFSRPSSRKSWRRKRLAGCWLDIDYSPSNDHNRH